jgi:hypothetical protein
VSVRSEAAERKAERRKIKRRNSIKGKLWLEAYFGKAMFNATEAARMAGFKDAEYSGGRMLHKYAEQVEQRTEELKESLTMSPDECQQRLAELARDKDHKDHFRALETIARIHGIMNDKLAISLDRKTLMRQLDEVLGAIAQQAPDALQQNSPLKQLSQ